jgi:ribosomal protein S18 acetylase RimI-like enzyme
MTTDRIQSEQDRGESTLAPEQRGARAAHVPRVAIRRAADGDLALVAQVHAAAFPRSFYTALGARFLVSYYRVILRSDKAVLLVAEDPAVLGFLAGSRDTLGVRQPVRWRQVVWPMLRGLLVRPHLWPRLLRRSLRYMPSRQPRGTQCHNSCEIGPMAVLPDHSGAGVGTQLVSAFLQWARELGAETVFLNTDPATTDVDRAARFYQRLGFRPVQSIRVDAGRVLTEYMLDLRST